MNLGPLFIGIATQSVHRDVLAAILGTCVGSFLNVLALRTLAEQPLLSTIFGHSLCPKCNHRLGPQDLIPIVSYLLLNGKCRYCKGAISWQYPAVEIVTAIGFVAILYKFQIDLATANNLGTTLVNAVGLDLAMIAFFSIMVAICVTDFREKLIPHEITYPSVLVGIAFSAFCRDDLMPSLAGIGISYILFDFLAFYGLKFYYLTHKDDEDAKKLDKMVRATDKDTLATLPDARESATRSAATESSEKSDNAKTEDDSAEAEQPTASTMRSESGTIHADVASFGTTQKSEENHQDDEDDFDPQIDETFGLQPRGQSEEEEEEFEVMGGGDAVLAGLIAAWLGLENLGVTLLFGFMIGSLMGSVYLAVELSKRGTLRDALRKTGLITLVLLLISEGAVYMFAYNTGMTKPEQIQAFSQLPWLAFAAASIFGGILLGTVLVGREGSKPFPFGPALAAGAMLAVFIGFKKLVLSDSCLQFGAFLINLGHN